MQKSSIFFINLLAIYPVSAVLQAVSIKPSLPPIVWKKNSVAFKPEKKLLLTNPLAAGCREFLSKCGKLLYVNPLGIL